MTDPWHTLRRFTQARIAQGRAGCALTTAALLDFQLAHAHARDAVLQPWNMQAFADDLAKLGLPVLLLATQVINREHYLQRPDLGRRLSEASRLLLPSYAVSAHDVALIVSNGLSSTAIDAHGLALLAAISSAYRAVGLRLGSISLVANARVALADEIGQLLGARLAVIVVGERPGLSAADSLGIYLTHAPRIGNTDAERNCIANVRPPAGLSYQEAAAKLAYLSTAALRLGQSGVALKDEMPWAVNANSPAPLEVEPLPRD